MARETGLEPAAPGVTGRYSNQLSYSRTICEGVISPRVNACPYKKWLEAPCLCSAAGLLRRTGIDPGQQIAVNPLEKRRFIALIDAEVVAKQL